MTLRLLSAAAALALATACGQTSDPGAGPASDPARGSEPASSGEVAAQAAAPSPPPPPSMVQVDTPEPPAFLAACNRDANRATGELTGAEREAAKASAFLNCVSEQEGVSVRPSGLMVYVEASGDPAGATPTPGQFVCVHYQGKLMNGTEFDSSYARGAPNAFPSDRLISGWVEALLEMRPGDHWKLVIPASIAYGDRGAPPDIAPGAPLYFDVQLLSLLERPARACTGLEGQ